MQVNPFYLGSIRVSDVLWFIPILRLAVLWIINLLTVIPVLWFLGFGILDLLGRKEVPVIGQSSRLSLLIVDKDLVCSIRVDDQGVQVGEDVILATDLFLGQEVLAVVVEDDVDLLGAGAANVRS
jgi:hypothetical protein